MDLDEVADELYAVPPEDFIALRTARQDEAKDDGDKALAKQMADFEAAKAMQLTNAQRDGASALFSSARADAHDMSQAIRWAWENCGELIDPHTAIGLHAARGGCA